MSYLAISGYLETLTLQFIELERLPIELMDRTKDNHVNASFKFTHYKQMGYYDVTCVCDNLWLK
jgi:hypothetical protein